MARPLNTRERQSVSDTIDFLKNLIECYERLPAKDQLPDQLRKIKETVDQLSQMLNDGLIDISSARRSVKASTDSKGIHLNDQSLQFEGELNVDDCEDGWFGVLWELIAVLLHEVHHYNNHTGVSGTLWKIPDTLFGGLALMIESALGETNRTWLWHEKQSYRFAYVSLNFLEHMMFMICLSDLDCLPCCEKHKDRASTVKKKQNPNSKH